MAIFFSVLWGLECLDPGVIWCEHLNAQWFLFPVCSPSPTPAHMQTHVDLPPSALQPTIFSGNYMAFNLGRNANHAASIPKGCTDSAIRTSGVEDAVMLSNQQHRYLRCGHLSESDGTDWLQITWSCQNFTWTWDYLKRQANCHTVFIFLPLSRTIIRHNNPE